MNRATILVIFSACFFLSAAMPGFCEKQVGSVQQITGSVLIDAFGTGDFIDAEEEDKLYEETVLRTGFESELEIMIRDEPMLIPADVEIRIERVLATSTKKRRFGWFSSVFNSIKRIISPKDDEKEEVLGGRAAEVEPSTSETAWIIGEDDDNELFKQARNFIDEERYSDALMKLDAIFFDPEKAGPGEVAFLKGHAYYGMGLFDVSVPSFEEALEEIEDFGIDVQYIDYYPLLLFELGFAHYMLDNFKEAISTLALAIENNDSELLPYAHLVFVMSVRDSGQTDEASRHAQEAAQTYKGTLFESEFTALISTEE